MPVQHVGVRPVFVERRSSERARAERGACARCGVDAVLEHEHCARCRRVVGVNLRWTGDATGPQSDRPTLLQLFAWANLGVPAVIGILRLFTADANNLAAGVATGCWALAHASAVKLTMRGYRIGWWLWALSWTAFLGICPFAGDNAGALALLALGNLLPLCREELRVELALCRANGGLCAAAVLALASAAGCAATPFTAYEPPALALTAAGLTFGAYAVSWYGALRHGRRRAAWLLSVALAFASFLICIGATGVCASVGGFSAIFATVAVVTLTIAQR